MQNGQNNQNVQKQKMTEEELQRTQVLNFDTFKQVARYEKLSSKKPAMIFALLGVLAILIGGGYPIVQSQMQKKTESNSQSTVQARKKDAKAKQTELTCTRTKIANESITKLNEKLTIHYSFEDDKLTSLTKELILNVPEGSTDQSPMQTYLTALEPYLIQQDGYKISVKQIENGVITTTEVDYKKLDVSKVPELNQKNEFFNIIYIAGTKSSAISEDMASQQFICS